MQDQWSWIFSNYGITDIWERGWNGSTDAAIYQTTIKIDTAAELPVGRPVVVLAPIDGRYIKGTKSIEDWIHPEDAIYLFGGSQANLNDEDDLGGITPHSVLYIPTVELEMYSHSAAYITLYDRKVKRGSFG